MQLRLTVAALLCVAAASSTSAAPSASQLKLEDPNVALSARELLHDPSHFGVGVLSTTYAADFADEGLRGLPLSGPEYFAPCYNNGDLLFLALPVSQNWRNVLFSDAHHNATFSIHPSSDPRVVDPRHARSHGAKWEQGRPSWRKGMPSKSRITLFGTLERVPAEAEPQATACFTSLHEDANHWIPGSDSPHTAIWARFRVERIYRVGGFGDESRIGWIERQAWREARPRQRGFDVDTPVAVDEPWVKKMWSAIEREVGEAREDVELHFGDSDVSSNEISSSGLVLQQSM